MLNPGGEGETMSSTQAQENVSNVDSLVAKYNVITATTTPETFADKQRKQQAEAKQSHRHARDNIAGIRLSLGSAMAAVKPKTIAKMATNAVSRRKQSSQQPKSLVSSPSQLPVEASNPAFSVLNEEDDVKVTTNCWWELAEAIHCDDTSNLFICMERCSTVKKFQRRTETDSRGSSNKPTSQLEKIYAMLQDNIEATNVRDAILLGSASFNSAAIARAILANNAANGVEWRSQQERALDVACHNGHLEVATVIACNDDGQVNSQLTQSLALRYYCLAGDMEHAREILIGDSPDATINAALLDACRNGRCDIVALLTADARFDQSVNGEEAFLLACGNGHVETVSML
jgi:hypothetical protein